MHRKTRRIEHDAGANCATSARVVLTGCGTALHAAMVGEYLIEQLANIPAEVEYASEFRHRNTPDDAATRSSSPSAKAAKQPTR